MDVLATPSNISSEGNEQAEKERACTNSEGRVERRADGVRPRALFATPIYEIDVSGSASLNRHLLQSIRDLRARSPEGIVRSNCPALGGWHSESDLHRNEAFSTLTRAVELIAKKISADFSYSANHALSIGTMWAISNSPGSFNKMHVHPQSLWSGVYYVQAPERSGRIEFIDPCTARVMNQPKFDANAPRPRQTLTTVRVAPKTGKAVIFPGWLYHSVEPNLSKLSGPEADRVIVSFNLTQRKVGAGSGG